MSFISNTGSWHRNNLNGHVYDSGLCNAIADYLKDSDAESVYDLGCGHGEYTRSLVDKGFYCSGYDGNPYTPNITSGLCEVLDLSEEHDLEVRDYVLCLEVGEHVPQQFESTLINNIHNSNSKGVVLSWAVEGQPGEGHVNCKNNDYVENIFLKLGYTQNKNAQEALREASSLWWFKNTIMVFEKPQKL